MKNEFGVPVPGWTVVASVSSGGLLALSTVVAVASDYSLGGLLAAATIAGAGAALAFIAHRAARESRRQTTVARAALAYRWGERPRSWRWHGWNIAAVTVVLVLQVSLALDDGSRWRLAGSVLFFGWVWSWMVLSAVQKWRHERSARGTSARAALRDLPPPVRMPDLPPKPVRGA